jgi:hypothetical protein
MKLNPLKIKPILFKQKILNLVNISENKSTAINTPFANNFDKNKHKILINKPICLLIS